MGEGEILVLDPTSNCPNLYDFLAGELSCGTNQSSFLGRNRDCHSHRDQSIRGAVK